ncbi:MAG: DUF4349 domain-containing protein [Patescibacteria group bacterium]
MKDLEWIKNNKLTAVLIVVVAYFLIGGKTSTFKNAQYGTGMYNLGSNKAGITSFMGADSALMEYDMPATQESRSVPGMLPPIIPEPTPTPDVSDRKVVRNASVSLLVKDVNESKDQIVAESEKIGGYMVSTQVHTPFEGGNGFIQVRIPAESLDSFLEKLSSYSIRVVSENIIGSDVTDQYVDTEERLRILERNKTRYEEIMEAAEDVDEILRVQNQIFGLQSQIDSLNGQLKKLDATSQTSLVSIDLSTDELALSYLPGSPWNPEVTAKLAVRSLVSTMRGLGDTLIWAGIYSILWVPAIIIFIIVRKRWTNKKSSKSK